MREDKEKGKLTVLTWRLIVWVKTALTKCGQTENHSAINY